MPGRGKSARFAATTHKTRYSGSRQSAVRSMRAARTKKPPVLSQKPIGRECVGTLGRQFAPLASHVAIGLRHNWIEGCRSGPFALGSLEQVFLLALLRIHVALLSLPLIAPISGIALINPLLTLPYSKLNTTLVLGIRSVASASQKPMGLRSQHCFPSGSGDRPGRATTGLAAAVVSTLRSVGFRRTFLLLGANGRSKHQYLHTKSLLRGGGGTAFGWGRISRRDHRSAIAISGLQTTCPACPEIAPKDAGGPDP